MSAPPWMPLYVADYLADTAHLSAAEHGAYLLLIMHYWRAGSLPTDEVRLARIARMSADEWAVAVPAVSAFFGDGWTHGRIDSELADATKTYERRAEAGRRGGAAKAAKQNPSNAVAGPQAGPQLSPPPSHSEEIQDGGGGSRASVSRLPMMEETAALTDQVVGLWLDPNDQRAETRRKDTFDTVHRWLVKGWKAEIVASTIGIVMVGLRRAGKAPPEVARYFEKAIARAHADAEAPLLVAMPSNDRAYFEAIHARVRKPNVHDVLDQIVRESRQTVGG